MGCWRTVIAQPNDDFILRRRARIRAGGGNRPGLAKCGEVLWRSPLRYTHTIWRGAYASSVTARANPEEAITLAPRGVDLFSDCHVGRDDDAAAAPICELRVTPRGEQSCRMSPVLVAPHYPAQMRSRICCDPSPEPCDRNRSIRAAPCGTSTPTNSATRRVQSEELRPTMQTRSHNSESDHPTAFDSMVLLPGFCIV